MTITVGNVIRHNDANLVGVVYDINKKMLKGPIYKCVGFNGKNFQIDPYYENWQFISNSINEYINEYTGAFLCG